MHLKSYRTKINRLRFIAYSPIGDKTQTCSLLPDGINYHPLSHGDFLVPHDARIVFSVYKSKKKVSLYFGTVIEKTVRCLM